MKTYKNLGCAHGAHSPYTPLNLALAAVVFCHSRKDGDSISTASRLTIFTLLYYSCSTVGGYCVF